MTHDFLDIEGWVRLYQMVGAAEAALNDEGEPLTGYDYSPENAGTTPTKIILFAMEAKRHESVTKCNQLCFDLCTAQSQRRALGLKDDVLFGGVFADGKFSIYSSYWYLVSEYCSCSMCASASADDGCSSPLPSWNFKENSIYEMQ